MGNPGLKLAPTAIYNIECVDIKDVVEDPDFSYLYQSIGDFGFSQLGEFGLDESDVSCFALITNDRTYIGVLIGDFDFKVIRNALLKKEYVEDEYRGVEIWAKGADTIAFVDSMLIFSDKDSVETCVLRHQNEESSLHDDEDMKSVAEKMPSGVYNSVFGPDMIYIDDLLAGGVCIQNQHPDDEGLDFICWLKFNSKESAEAALEDTKEEFEMNFLITQINLQLRDQFIEVTGQMEIP